MSLEIIEYQYIAANGISGIIDTIKQRTGLELKQLDGNTNGIAEFSIRFPDMETAQSVRFAYLNISGTFFIDADNHFLMLTTNSGAGYSDYVNEFFPIIIFDYKGTLYNVCYAGSISWDNSMNANCSGNLPGYQGNDVTKQDITLVPLRVSATNPIVKPNQSVKSFIKNCYTNYERKFQRALKFMDQNGNKFVTLGGYLLYKID